MRRCAHSSAAVCAGVSDPHAVDKVGLGDADITFRVRALFAAAAPGESLMQSHRPRLLVVDEDRDIQTTVGALALREGYDVATTASGAEAITHVRQRPAQLALVDVGRTGVSGVELLQSIRSADRHCRVALMSRDTSPEQVVDAIACGAVDYLRKPLDVERVRMLLAGVRAQEADRRAVLAVEAEIARRLEFCGMIGRGPAMQAVFDWVRRLAPHVRLALITGEPGTGKQLAARALHALGPRRAAPFLVVNCSAVVETLFERELFGHGRDVFTGAAPSAGLLESADGGTVFLEHVGDLPVPTQTKLLQVLDTRCVPRVGSVEWRRVDIHVIAATSRNLRREVAAGRFNAALYERLALAEITLPPLRERPEDLTYLTAAFVRSFAERFSKPLAGLTTEAEQVLHDATWEGNVRELRAVLERACILADGDFITEADLLAIMRHSPAVPGSSPPPVSGARVAKPSADLPAPLYAVEREHIVRALEHVHGNKAEAARLLGVSRRAFYRQLERHRLHLRAGAGKVASAKPDSKANQP